MNVSNEQYQTMTALHLPLELPDGFVFVALEFQCPYCSDTLADVRYTLAPFPNCVELIFAGVCKREKLLVTVRFRHYGRGRILEDRDGRWISQRVSPYGFFMGGMVAAWNWVKKTCGFGKSAGPTV